MKNRTLLLLVFSVFWQPVYALPDDPVAYSDWEVRTLLKVEELGKSPVEIAIPGLGTWVHKLALHHQLEKGDRPVYRAAQDALLSIPGHAEWYGKEIRRLTEEEINGGYGGHKRMWYYETLRELPSPETVKVLGELIFDERDPWKGGNWGDGGRPFSNALHATKAFTALGIHNAPVRALAYSEGDQRTWQLWFEQVKAGARTFSFEGDDTVYNLEGPVRLNSSDGRSNRESSPSESNNGEDVVSGGSLGLPVKITLAIVILIAGFTFWRVKNSGR